MVFRSENKRGIISCKASRLAAPQVQITISCSAAATLTAQQGFNSTKSVIKSGHLKKLLTIDPLTIIPPKKS